MGTTSDVSRKKVPPKTAGAPPPGWIQDILNIMCPKDKAFLDTLRARAVTIIAFDRIYFEDPYYDGTRWTTRHFEAGGSTQASEINMIRSASAEENAATIYHEGVHTGQPASMVWRDKEYQAYVAEDHWRMSHGIPPHDPTFRIKDAAGDEITNVAAIRTMVDNEYPGVTAQSSGGPPEQVVGRTPSGKTTVKRGDGSTYNRPPKRGDSFPGRQRTIPRGGIPVHVSTLKCP